MRRAVPAAFARLAAAGLTYPEVGATRSNALPADYGHVFRDVEIGSGRPAFEQAAERLLGWQMHRRAGFALAADAETAATGVTVILRAGRRPLHLSIPCRVVYTVDEKHRRGFAYGTLPGHPEQGEEAFIVHLTEAGHVRLQIRAFSRPASLLARCGGRWTRMIQQYATDRYVEALRDLARPDVRP